MLKSIYPNWLAPKNVHALTTTRLGGVSIAPFDSLNLGIHVNDDLDSVLLNRRLLVEHEQLPNQPLWLNQVHSTTVVDDVDVNKSAILLDADATYSCKPNQVCAVLTADCLPVILCNAQGNEIAAIHAGWRGLCNGIIENTVQKFIAPSSQIIAWLGPAIGPTKFEVGQEVVDQFVKHDAKSKNAFKFSDSVNKKYLADLYQLATLRLNHLGIEQIYGGNFCTYTQSDLFYSYRREKQTGRMATLIWFD
ncbi:peptidoglycan editing factor PgeF [Orbaceae bacterium ac157xtp]